MTRLSQMIALSLTVLLIFTCTACGEAYDADAATASSQATSQVTDNKEISMDGKMIMRINDTEVDVSWEDNDSVMELRELAASGLTIQMSMYGGFEQVGSIGKRITKNDKQVTTHAGDIVLYSGDQLVVFYGSNSWSYTRLGKIELPEAELAGLLGDEDVTITLTVR